MQFWMYILLQSTIHGVNTQNYNDTAAILKDKLHPDIYQTEVSYSYNFSLVTKCNALGHSMTYRANNAHLCMINGYPIFTTIFL